MSTTMERKQKCIATITAQVELASGIFSMWLKFPKDYNVAGMAVPGQFLSLYSRDGSLLLPRPISICEINGGERLLRIVYRVAGQGTEEFSGMNTGDTISVMGPLGNGFTQKEGVSLLIGGGIGIPPMLALAKELSGNVQVVLGYRDGHLFLKEEFEPYASVYVATEDGSVGVQGNVIDAIRAESLTADTIYACGPMPMLRGVKEFAVEQQIPAQISLEERMACGIGACLGCVCKTGQKDSHSHVNNARICKDGPVFDARTVEI